jgi:superfamily II DNA or RNA helicase/diadenosine tetraphosphate (Ap4A) HIT family hydrolase
MTSAFLEKPTSTWIASNALAFAIRDGFPVTEGHTLVIPKRVVATWFEATREEQRAILDLIEEVKRQLDSELHPDGYNVGFNHGEAAGQTVMHLHMHVIPRYTGDMDDPRGGVRHVIPWKGNYKKAYAAPLSTGGTSDPFLAHLQPLFATATEVSVVAAFVQDSGLEVLQGAVSSVLERGGRVRLVTGDYLNITQVEALKRILDWQGAFSPSDKFGGFLARVVETGKLPGNARSFHPKSWRFEGPDTNVAFVGSSNVSYSALKTGVEWNLRLDRAKDADGYRRVAEAFELVWQSALPLSFEWVSGYSDRARKDARPLPPGDDEEEPFVGAPPAHAIQNAALDALAASRDDGRRRALVVMATGLGKTLLAALDADRVRTQSPGGRFRILFIAHRRELLGQAAETFRRVMRRSTPDFRIGWFADDRSELDGDMVVASVQKLSRPENLAELRKCAFDYVVVDEVHHADAPSYRNVLAQIEPGFLLGLTATPDRADEGDILGLFDDHLAYRADLGTGIDAGKLVPFAYFGLKDVVNYANIRWRNRRFDPGELAAAVQTQERMARLWEAWAEHAGTRSLVFCCTVQHAEFVRGWLADRGVRAVAVYAAAGSADRERALSDLEQGSLDAVCAVDLFNEGVDVPRVDRVVMLRPTESPVLFLQQLGRGLRTADGKDKLTVIDFVGNHSVFLNRVRLLLSFGQETADLASYLREGVAPRLPEGCSLDIELVAIDLLRKRMPSGASEVERVYREIAASRDRRPTIGELYRMRYSPGTLRGAHGSWFEFVAKEGHLDDSENAVLSETLAWFRQLETTQMTKSFKMVLLQALIDAEALGTGLPLVDLAVRSHAVLERSPELRRDLEGVKELADLRGPESRSWLSFWRNSPVAAWCGESGNARKWFRIEGDRFVPQLPIPVGREETFVDMTRELIDYRLAQYRRRRQSEEAGQSFECKIISNKRDPILKLPDRDRRPDLPRDDVDARLPDGSVWTFRFAKEFCNIARPPGAPRNQLSDLLRRWFGLSVGRPGTAFRVRFFPTPDGWSVEPIGQIVELPPWRGVAAYPSLRAAAGAVSEGVPEIAGPEAVALPVRSNADNLFAVRATGDSMQGGATPINDGDWLVFKLSRGVGLGAVKDRVALLQTDVSGDHAFQVKRVVQEESRWLLRSENLERPSYEATDATIPIATLVDIFRPEQLAPSVGALLDAKELQERFGFEGDPVTGRVRGHLFIVLDGDAVLVEPDCARLRVADRRPGETAFVLASTASSDVWRYCGVGRVTDDETEWAIPEVDFATWRARGAGREASRRLPRGVEERAQAIVEAMPTAVGDEGWIEGRGRRCRIVGRSARGGLRIDGGPDGFAERTVSIVDIAWVLVAEDHVRENGGVLDEARVNRLRYLEGTPKGSTRWIDTGWATVMVAALGASAPDPMK